MHHISFISRGRGMALAKFFMLCVITLVLSSNAGVAYAKKGDKDAWRPEVGGSEIGGYTGPGPEPVSIKQALSMPDGTWVSIKGNVSKYLGGKEYTITDSTGVADAEIGAKAWMGQNVAASDTVLFQGRVKKQWSQTRIDVKRIIKQ